ncbi:MAG: hypothetical protein U0L76_01010 [Ruminococcus sp.]|nr:hypothetical protein [Ruminococcus sp.]
MNQTEIILINSSIPIIKEMYSEKDASDILNILLKGRKKGCFEDDDVYELLRLLPLIIPFSKEEEQTQNDYEDDWFDESEAEYQKRKRKIDELNRMLSHRLFLQQSVYDKQLWDKNALKKSNGLANY